jgi:hypothetical protein
MKLTKEKLMDVFAKWIPPYGGHDPRFVESQVERIMRLYETHNWDEFMRLLAREGLISALIAKTTRERTDDRNVVVGDVLTSKDYADILDAALLWESNDDLSRKRH